MQRLPSVYGQRSQINGADPLAVGMVGWWPLQDGGPNAVDASANGNLGIGTGAPTHSIAPFGRAFVFDGSTQYVNCGASTSLCPPACTVSCWINPTSLTPAYSSLVNRVNTAGTNFSQLFIKSSGKLALYVVTNGGVVSYDGSGTYTLATGNWYNIVWTYDVSVGLRAYVNGLLDASAAAVGTLPSYAASLYIAEDSFTAGRRFAGQMADVRMLGRALVPSEVMTLYLEQSRPFRRRAPALGRATVSPFQWSPMTPGQHQPIAIRPEVIPY